MDVEKWKKKNNFRQVGNCYLCKHHIWNPDWTYSCKRLNRSVKGKVVLTRIADEAFNICCDKYEGW